MVGDEDDSSSSSGIRSCLDVLPWVFPCGKEQDFLALEWGEMTCSSSGVCCADTLPWADAISDDVGLQSEDLGVEAVPSS